MSDEKKPAAPAAPAPAPAPKKAAKEPVTVTSNDVGEQTKTKADK